MAVFESSEGHVNASHPVGEGKAATKSNGKKRSVKALPMAILSGSSPRVEPTTGTTLDTALDAFAPSTSYSSSGAGSPRAASLLSQHHERNGMDGRISPSHHGVYGTTEAGSSDVSHGHLSPTRTRAHQSGTGLATTPRSRPPSLLRPRPTSTASLDVDVVAGASWPNTLENNQSQGTALNVFHAADGPDQEVDSEGANGKEDVPSRKMGVGEGFQHHEMYQASKGYPTDSIEASGSAVPRKASHGSALTALRHLESHSPIQRKIASRAPAANDVVDDTPQNSAADMNAHPEALLLRAVDEAKQDAEMEELTRKVKAQLAGSAHDEQGRQPCKATSLLAGHSGGLQQHRTLLQAGSQNPEQPAQPSQALRKRSGKQSPPLQMSSEGQRELQGIPPKKKSPWLDQIRADGKRVDEFLSSSSLRKEHLEDRDKVCVRAHIGLAWSFHTGSTTVTSRSTSLFAGRDVEIAIPLTQPGSWVRWLLHQVGLVSRT